MHNVLFPFIMCRIAVVFPGVIRSPASEIQDVLLLGGLLAHA